jgi:hypothetical protein
MEVKGKREKTPELAHKRFSPKIIPYFNEPQELYEVLSTVDEEAKGMKLTSHLCRQIYANVCLELYCSENEDASSYVGRILGHSDEDTVTSASYMADVRTVLE